MSISMLTVNGTDRTILKDTLRVTKELNSRDTLECTLVAQDGSDFGLKVGQVLLLVDSGSRQFFAGTLDSFDYNLNSSAANFWDVKGVGFDELADRFTVPPATYPTGPAENVLRNIVDSYFPSAEQVVASNIPNGMPTLVNYTISQRTKISDVFNDVAQRTGWAWNTIYDSTNGHTSVRFFNPTVGIGLAPFILTDGSITFIGPATKYESLKFVSDRATGPYANRIYAADTAPRTESVVGDGVTRTWTLAAAIQAPPSITVNNIAKSVGVLGTDTGREYYYQIGSKVITQDSSLTILMSTDTLTVSAPTSAGATDDFIGDGSTRSWTLSNALSSVPTITINGVSATAGVAGGPTAQFYYTLGSATITQESTDPVLTSSDTLEVSYQTETMVEDTGEQSGEATREGRGSGIYELILSADTSGTTTNPLDLAKAALRKQGNMRYDIDSFVVTNYRIPTADNLLPGQTISVHVAGINVDRTDARPYLIASTTLSDRDGGINVWECRLVRGEYQKGWESFFDVPQGAASAVVTTQSLPSLPGTIATPW